MSWLAEFVHFGQSLLDLANQPIAAIIRPHTSTKAQQSSLQEIFYAHVQVHNFMLGYYLNRFTFFNAPKHISFLILSSAAALNLPHSVLALRLPLLNTQSPSDWSAHTCLNQHSLQQQSSHAKSILTCQTSS